MLEATRTNLANVGMHYLKCLQIPVTKTELEQRLEEQPFYPSLFSLKAVFDHYNIPNQAFSLKPENLDQAEPPFIAYAHDGVSRDFVLVTKISAAKVRYISNGNRSKEVTKEKFLGMWEKIIFVAEKNEVSGDKEYRKKQKEENRKNAQKYALSIAAIAAIALLIGLTFLQIPASLLAPAIFILLIKLAGVVITGLLLLYELDKTNSIVKNFCSAGRQVNCDAVLNSKAAKIFGVQWSEIGFFYFASTLLFTLLPGIGFGLKMPWLAVVNIVAAPYILYSIYYQWRVVKQWCLLCLAVQAVLLMELSWSIINYWSNAVVPDVQPASVLAVLFALVIPPAIWYMIKPVLINAKEERKYRAAYKRMLYDPERFESLLGKQAIAPDHDDLGIIVGNPAAATTIVKVCNPYCGPCAKAHAVLDEIIQSNQSIKLKIIFNAFNDEKDRRKKPVAHLLAIYSKGNEALTLEALHDWYSASEKDYEAFALKYPLNGELEKQGEKIEAMHEWCKKAEIVGTPTVFINGNKLPENYSIEELKNIYS